jgi:hypothetical protein
VFVTFENKSLTLKKKTMEDAKNTKKNIVKVGVLFPDHDFVLVNGISKRIDKDKEIELPEDMEGFVIEIPYIENEKS